jgi:hypothetical protein
MRAFWWPQLRDDFRAPNRPEEALSFLDQRAGAVFRAVVNIADAAVNSDPSRLDQLREKQVEPPRSFAEDALLIVSMAQ